MANVFYTRLVTTVSAYLGNERAVAVIGRQLVRCQATSDSITAEDLRSIMANVVGATTLHLAPDKAKQQELTEKLKAIV